MTTAEELTEEEIAEVRHVGRTIKQAIIEGLPEETRTALRRYHRAKAEAARVKSESKKQRTAERTRRILELMLNGHNQAEVGRAMKITDDVVSYTVRQIWPFPKPGRDNRYFAARLSPADLSALDDLAADMLLSRSRALEEICRVALETNATVARRLLHVAKREKAQ